MPFLEVIALSAADARAARSGGADRVELVGTMDDDGLSPSLKLLDATLNAHLPVRPMLRLRGGFATDAHEVAQLRALLQGYRRAGADGVVLGFLDSAGNLDAPVLRELLYDAELPYTLHRAIDHAADYRAAWSALDQLPPGCTHVLTAGSAAGVSAGMEQLCTVAAEVPGAAQRIMAGGGLRKVHVHPLREAGIDAFHIGSPVRPGGRFDQPVDSALVETWREVISAGHRA